MSEFAHRHPIPVSEIFDAAGPELAGSLEGVAQFGWIERNSQAITPGDLFIAVRGERFDGHQFVQDAANRGAAAALVSRTWFAELDTWPDIPLLVVDDPVKTLQRVAAARRRGMVLEVVGVTGSIGKTSTKEAIAAGIRQVRSTYWSPGNMNSEIGLPLSILEIPSGTEVAVLEMGGAYAFGELALLAEIAQPSVGVVTNIYPVHLERMGSIEAIAKTKAELVESLPASGLAVLNVDFPWVREMRTGTDASVVTFGLSEDADVRARNVRTLGLRGISFQLVIGSDETEVSLPLVGVHSVEMALAAIAVGTRLGLSLEQILTGIGEPAVQVRLVPMAGPNGSQLLDDTYNASAPSVLSALRLLQEIPAGRKIAVLGDMRELGAEAAEQHKIVGEYAADVANLLVTYGPLGRQIADAAARVREVDGLTFGVQSFDLEQREELTQFLMSELRPGDTALLKGSRGLEMETIVDVLRTAAVSADADA